MVTKKACSSISSSAATCNLQLMAINTVIRLTQGEWRMILWKVGERTVYGSLRCSTLLVRIPSPDAGSEIHLSPTDLASPLPTQVEVELHGL
jgi:hypothetical protein